MSATIKDVTTTPVMMPRTTTRTGTGIQGTNGFDHLASAVTRQPALDT